MSRHTTQYREMTNIHTREDAEEMSEALSTAIDIVREQYIDDGLERTAMIALDRLHHDDLSTLFKFAPFDALKSVQGLVETLSHKILSIVAMTKEPTPQLLTELHLVIQENIRRNLGFLRHNLNLYEGFRDDRALTLETLISEKDRIFAERLGKFTGDLLSNSVHCSPSENALLAQHRPCIERKLLPLFLDGTIKTINDLYFSLQQFDVDELPYNVRFLLRRLFNDMLIDVNKNLIRAIDLVPERDIASPEHALDVWTKRRNATVHKIDAVGPFLNSLINRLWLDQDENRPNQLTTDLRPPNELRQALLSELLDDMDVDRVMRRSTLAAHTTSVEAAKKEANRHAHLAQLIALKTGHSLSITYSDVLKKVSNLLRLVDIQSVAPKNNKLLYVLWNDDKKRNELHKHPNPDDIRHVRLQTNGHSREESPLTPTMDEDGNMGNNEEALEQSMRRAKHTPYIMNLRTWVDAKGREKTSPDGHPFMVHFCDINEKQEDPIDAKLRGDVSHIEEIFDLARMNFWLTYTLEEILADDALHETIMEFATDLGTRGAGLTLREYNKKEDRYILAPGEFMILSNLRRTTSKKSAVNTFKDIRLYCQSYDGVGFEIQIVPIDIALKEKNTDDFMNHGWLEVMRQLRVILEEASYMYDPEIHELIPRIQHRISYLSTLEEAPENPSYAPIPLLRRATT